MRRIIPDIITIILVSIPALLVSASGLYDIIVQITVFGGATIIILANIATITLSLTRRKEGKLHYNIDFTAMIFAYIILIGIVMGEVLAVDPIIPLFDWNAIPFGYYITLSLSVFLVITNTMSKIPNSVVYLVAFPIIIVTMGARLLLSLWDLIFTPRIRELVPYLQVTRDLILNTSQAFADPNRVEIEDVLNDLGDTKEHMDELTEGYALRKGIGQSIDVGLTVVVFAFLGVLTYLTDDIGIPPQIIAIFFASLALAFSTFAGFFGPFYGLAGACKNFTLRYGSYRAASIYKVIENVFAIPFNVATAGFLFLDLPPVDADSLEDFKSDMQQQLGELTSNISSLLGRDKGAIPKKTQKMIAELVGSTEANLNKLDFRNLREETAREFALTYFQHEFSWKPWERKSAVSEFAEKYHFDQQLGEENLMLIGDKIKAGQMDEDMVNNVMISAALRGIVQIEQKYQETLADIELGQTCTGLAFGARQFLKDHYILQSRYERWSKYLWDFFIGIFAIPIVTIIAFHNYANRFYNKLIDIIAGGIFEKLAWETLLLRSREIVGQVEQLPNRLRRKKDELLEPKSEEEIKQRNWQIKRRIRRLVGMIWEVIVFPFMIIFNGGKLIYRKLSDSEENPREGFEEAVAHAALVSIYDSLFQNLVMQTHVSTGY